jgi:hypothetical protein
MTATDTSTYDRVYVVPAADLPDAPHTGHRTAAGRRSMFVVDDAARGVRLRAAYEEAEARRTPKHRHTFEQVYFHLAGEDVWDDKPRRYGDIAYTPESTWYGPQWSDGGNSVIVLQFASYFGRYFGSNEELKRAMAGLRDRGVEFREGLAIWPDGREQDSTEACFEHLLGGEFEYAPSRYDEPVVVHSEAVPWVPSPVDGVEVRHVGYFNEYGPNIKRLRLAPGAETPAGVSTCVTARFVYEGRARYGDTDLDPVSFLYYPPGVEFESLRSPDGAEVFQVQIATPGTEAPPFEQL